ncbi:glycosyl hydrolase family 28-related protein [Demequina sp. NBRC 110056]|uniref:glycosyl hydrolase family 28-related protein n=1 Tax=Demequina sp. NBRC 110056 TaxID=1570345 RepID=UPI001F1EA5E6|nr:glycosyl hydrolase family 28-related protein [Demequina sp. NBRC 110056]
MSAEPVVTRAALDPKLVEGRGADVAFFEQEAENGVTTGEVIAGRDAYTLPSEASGRAAVMLDPGEHVEFVLPEAANAVTIRYAIPDAPGGGGITAPLDLWVDGGHRHKVTLTSEYSWLYNTYPFTNDPDASVLQPDWWIAECACVPSQTDPTPAFDTPFRPHHFYDEQRVQLKKTFAAGSVLRLEVPRKSNAEWTVIDLVDTELVAPPVVVDGAVSVTDHGADRTGRRDSAGAFDAAIVAARDRGVPVYVPAGTFRVDRHIIVDDVTIIGAGSWHSIIRGSEVELAEPASDGSTHTGVGFYGKPANEGGSSNVHLEGFAIEGDVRERIDDDQVNGIGGAMSDSTITGLYIHHTKVGIWFDGPIANTHVTDTVIADQIADAVNFHRGVTDSSVSNTFVRNTGDDGLAMWSLAEADARNTFAFNTVQSPVLANGIALYGGSDLTVEGNLVADPVREGSGLHLGARFGAEPFAGAITFRDNTVVRAAPLDLNWDIGLGAIWLYALDRSIDADVLIEGDHYLDSTYNALMLVTEWGVKDLYAIENVTVRDVRVDGTGTSVVSARSMGSAAFENVDARNVGARGVNNCGAFGWDWVNGSEFSLVDLGGNDGLAPTPWEPDLHPWLGRYVPNIISCEDRPAVVAPPAPSPWGP